jgi:hypothetical protein
MLNEERTLFNESKLAYLNKKWAPVLEHADLPKIDNAYRRNITAVLLENQEMFSRNEAYASAGGSMPRLLSEAAPTNSFGASSSTAATGNIDIFDPVLISLVRRSMPNLMAYDVCGVQPMSGPVGLVFAMRSRYTSQTGKEALFNEANTNFSATAAGNTSHQSGNSSYSVYTGSDPTESGYGAQSGFNTSFAEKLGDASGNAFQEMAFSIEKISVTAVARALKAEYSTELAQDLKAIHGLDAESELSNILSSEILSEINREVIRSINMTATAGAQQNVTTAGTFNLDTDANGRWAVERFKGMIFQIDREANQIARSTRRGRGNVMICSSDLASALNMAGMLDYTPALANNLETDDTGNTFAGILNKKIKVYIDPYFISGAGKQYFTMGYRGASQLDAGLFYCPYVPLQMVRAVGENTFQPKIGFKTRYGMVANPFATTAADGVIAAAKKNIYYRLVGVSNIM